MSKNKKRIILSTKLGDVEHMNFLSQYLGKDVFSADGEKVGKIRDVVFEKGSHKGFLLGSNIFIDKEYFTKNFDQAMMLEINPVTLLKGKLVFDVDGKKMGKVLDIERTNNSNDYKALFVRKHIFSKPFIVEKKYVDKASKNILLKVSFEKFVKK